jgi:hypothetical protein
MPYFVSLASFVRTQRDLRRVAKDSGNKELWQERKESYIQRLRKEPAEIQLISAADKLYNARAILEDYREIGPEIWKRFKRGRNDQIKYFNALLEVFRASGCGRIVHEFERAVADLTHISAHEGS